MSGIINVSKVLSIYLESVIYRSTMDLKGDTMVEFLFKKNVDQSVLEAGMTISRDSHQKLLRGLGITLSRGSKEKSKMLEVKTE